MLSASTQGPNPAVLNKWAVHWPTQKEGKSGASSSEILGHRVPSVPPLCHMQRPSEAWNPQEWSVTAREIRIMRPPSVAWKMATNWSACSEITAVMVVVGGVFKENKI